MRYGLVLAAVAAFVVACGGGAGATPKETFESMKTAMVNKDFGKIWDLMADSMHKEIDEQLTQMKTSASGEMPAEAKEAMEKMTGIKVDELKNMTARDFFIKAGSKFLDDKAVQEAKDTVFVEEKIEGDNATVKVKKGDKEDTITMVKKDGKWYVADMK